MTPRTETLMRQFKALADPVRLRIVALCGQGECSVSELTKVLGQSQPRVSQHLKQLCRAELLERFRDGHYMYYRLATAGGDAASRRQLLALVPRDDTAFGRDARKLRELRGTPPTDIGRVRDEDRALHRALVALTVTAPLGDIIDIGCGHGRVLKLLASRARRAVGVDIDPDARRLARASVLLAGLPNCTLRQGDMYALPFDDGAFDTVILDDVLRVAERPTEVLAEAARILRPGGRLLLLASTSDAEAAGLASSFADWCAACELRLAAPKPIPARGPSWLLAVATPNDTASAAA